MVPEDIEAKVLAIASIILVTVLLPAVSGTVEEVFKDLLKKWQERKSQKHEDENAHKEENARKDENAHKEENAHEDENVHNDDKRQADKDKEDMKVVKKLKRKIGKRCDAYEEKIEKVIEEWDSISEDAIIEFFSEEKEELEELLNNLYEYEGSVARILPNQIEEYQARRDDLRKVQESITKFINKGESLDLYTTLNQYQGDINALYSVFKEIVDADAINI